MKGNYCDFKMSKICVECVKNETTFRNISLCDVIWNLKY